MTTSNPNEIADSLDLFDRQWLLNPVGQPTTWLTGLGLALGDGRVTRLGEEVTQILIRETGK